MSGNDKVIGHTPLSQEQINMINSLKEREIDLLDVITGLCIDDESATFNVDKRWASIAKTHFQEGFMALVRSIARPNGD